MGESKRSHGQLATGNYQDRPLVPVKTHKHKRSRTRSPESNERRRDSGKGKIFVVQKHGATSLHYDFRIEIDGVLRSWAVPKGPSTDPREKRLAIPTEDHALDYADFEGVIPETNYGGGTVMVWDRGRYDNITKKGGKTIPISVALKQGHALIRLHGRKLTGGYALQRTGEDSKARWLLVKMDDKEADARRNPISTQPKSVLSGRTMAQIARGDDPAEGRK